VDHACIIHCKTADVVVSDGCKQIRHVNIVRLWEVACPDS